MIVKLPQLLDNSKMLLSKIDRLNKLIIFTAVLCLLAFIASCSPASPSPQNVVGAPENGLGGIPALQAPKAATLAPPPSLVSVNSLALAPVRIASEQVSKNLANFDVSRIIDELKSAFRVSTNSDVVELSEIKGFSNKDLTSGVDRLLAIAKQNNFDGLLVAEMQSFSDRSGSAIGTNEDAEFGIALKVIEVASGKLAWEGNFHEKDSAGPLLSITGGEVKKPVFRSIDSLMKEGFAKLAADFASARLRTYMAK